LGIPRVRTFVVAALIAALPVVGVVTTTPAFAATERPVMLAPDPEGQCPLDKYWGQERRFNKHSTLRTTCSDDPPILTS
jgi:hypothetical protein